MTQEELKSLLDVLLAQWENEVVEFKRGGKGFSTGDIGEYFSALSNEANLACFPRAWLVFGVDNKTRKVVGTDYDASAESLNKPGGLKYQITQRTDPGVCFNNVHVLYHPDGRVVFFEIPAAPKGIPIAWNGHYYARSGENLVALGLDKLDAIRRQGLENDWSAEVVGAASYNDLDEQALAVARRGFVIKHSRQFKEQEILGWSLRTFLDKAQLTRNGLITRAALLLVGKSESAHLLSPHPAQLVWKLVGEENANDIFYPPFLLTTTHLNARIRNVQIRILPEGSLVADEVPKYKDESILEALHNCIAHQDYRRNGRVVVTEYVDRLAFSNQGGFYEGRPEDYMHGDKMPTRYRNLQLVKAMREINMIDTMGYGIHRLYNWQVERYFPLPDYKVKSGSVEVTIYGHVVDPAYSSLLLLKRGDLSLDDIALLDRIQKNLSVSSRAVAHLKRAGLVEGRKPHYHISASVAAATGQKAEYMKKWELPGRRYRQLIVDYIGKFEGASRKDINEFMLDEIRGELSVDEKTVKITNLLTYLRRNGVIERRGATKNARWFIVDKTK